MLGIVEGSEPVRFPNEKPAEGPVRPAGRWLESDDVEELPHQDSCVDNGSCTIIDEATTRTRQAATLAAFSRERRTAWRFSATYGIEPRETRFGIPVRPRTVANPASSAHLGNQADYRLDS